MRRVLGIVIGAAVGLGLVGALLLRVPAVQDRLFRRAVEAALKGQPDHLFDEDSLRVLLCGSASPLPHPTRERPCVAVFAGGRFYLVDVGPGSWNRMAGWRIDAGRVGGVLLTHFHSDHIGELGEVDLQTWVGGRPGPLRVIGPPGVERVVAGFEAAYALDTGYRIAHHGAELLPPEAAPMQALVVAGPARGEGPATALQDGELVITAFAVDHAPISPAYGYRFDYRGRSVVVSGDTVKLPAVVEASRDADVLVHEAQANHLVATMREIAGQAGRKRAEKILGDIPDYHTTPVEAAEVANEANVRFLLMYHLTPPPPLSIVESMFVRGVAEVRDHGWMLGDDGTLVTLPVGSDAIDISSLE